MASRPQYVRNISNEYLNKHKTITGTNPGVVEAKAENQLAAWAREEEAKRAEEREYQRLEKQAEDYNTQTAQLLDTIGDLLNQCGARPTDFAIDSLKIVQEKSAPEPAYRTPDDVGLESTEPSYRSMPSERGVGVRAGLEAALVGVLCLALVALLCKVLSLPWYITIPCLLLAGVAAVVMLWYYYMPSARDRMRHRMTARTTAKNKAEQARIQTAERNNRTKLARLKKENAVLREQWRKKVEKIKRHNSHIDEQMAAYLGGDRAAAEWYFTNVLKHRDFGLPFCKQEEGCRCRFGGPDEGLLVVDVAAPAMDNIPEVEAKKVGKRDRTVTDKPMKEDKRYRAYYSMLKSMTIVVANDLRVNDRAGHVKEICVNTNLTEVNPATGKEETKCLVSLSCTPEQLADINFSRAKVGECFRHLNGKFASTPGVVAEVKPIYKIDTTKDRLIEAKELEFSADGIDLVNIDPFDFEHLVTGLLKEMGLKAAPTVAHKDGGLDIVIEDEREIMGGKYSIQCKRYNNKVALKEVREFFGALQSKPDINKGIIITTSSFTRDAMQFANEHGIQLIEGGRLVYYLQKHGHTVKAVPEAMR